MSKKNLEGKHLYRSKTDRIFAGLCGGVGEYLNVDPLVIRLFWLLLTFLGGSGILVYLIGWLIIPENQKSQQQNYYNKARRRLKIISVLFFIIFVLVVFSIILSVYASRNRYKTSSQIRNLIYKMKHRGGYPYELMESAMTYNDFYYPKYYINGFDEILHDRVPYGILSYYYHPDDKRVEISLNWQQHADRRPPPTKESCTEIAQRAINQEGTGIVIKAEKVENDVSHGCKIIIFLGAGENMITNHFKILWFKTYDEFHSYVAKAVYYENLDEKEKNLLDFAVEYFRLKEFESSAL